MNVLKKINSFCCSSLIILNGVVFSLMPLSSMAQNGPTITGGQHLTPGYTTLVLDYPRVQSQMKNEVLRGNAAQWRTWMDAGLQKNESLYWWLLAEWLWDTNKTDDAYKAAIQAFVFMRVEMAGCGYPSGEITRTTNEMLRQHVYIFTQTPSQETIKTAVLEAISRAQNHLKRGQILPEMSCHFYDAQQARMGKSHTVKIETTPRNEREFQRKMTRQQTALKNIKNEMAYSSVFHYSDANILWKAQNSK